jgi:hypothetical protein
LQGVVGPLAAQITAGQALEFVVDEGHEGFKSLLIAFLPSL